MSSLSDFLDDFVLGPLNLLDWIEGLVIGFWYRDFGYELAIPRADKGGEFSLNETRDLLANYGVATYGRRFDAQNMYIRVKNRQARWAEYVLLHAGVELLNPTVDARNPGYVAGHEPGWMPRPWRAGRAKGAHEGQTRSGRATTETENPKGLLDWLDAL